MEVRELKTTSDVMDALGGTTRVAELTGRKVTAASNWRKFPKFPANTFLVISQELEQRGLSAPASLWGMPERAA